MMCSAAVTTLCLLSFLYVLVDVTKDGSCSSSHVYSVFSGV